MASEKRNGGIFLAARAGRYREYAPPPVLRRHFSRLWSHSLHDGPTATVAIVPDGYCDLLWIGGRLFVAGPDRTAAFPLIRPGTTVISARFAPGAAAPWLKTPLSALVGCSVRLCDIGRKGTADFEARLEDCRDAADAMALFARLLEEAAREEEEPAPDAAVIFAAAESGCSPSSLLHRLDISERQLRRRCHHHFGYGAKTLERIRRFQRFLDLCRRAHAMPLAHLALEAGFADQAHMTREVGELSRLTPAVICDQLNARELPGSPFCSRRLGSGCYPRSTTIKDLQAMSTMPAKIIHQSIERDWRDVYDFAGKPENMPLWASGLATGLEPNGADWVAHGPLGTIKVSFVPANEFGVIDHTVTIESGLRVYNALRIVPNGDGCEIMFTLLRLPGMTDAQFSADAAHVEKDLAMLKALMER